MGALFMSNFWLRHQPTPNANASNKLNTPSPIVFNSVPKNTPATSNNERKLFKPSPVRTKQYGKSRKNRKATLKNRNASRKNRR